MPSLRASASLLLLALPTAGCNRILDAPGPPAEVEAVSAVQLTGTVASALADSLVVRVTDARGKPVRGATVRWEATPGSGTVEPGSSVTDAKGRAAARWTLGTAAGEQSAGAGLQGAGETMVWATFRATARPGPVASVAPSPPKATVPVDSTLALQARLTDAHGNPVTDAAVAWSSADTALATVDAAGVLRARRSGRVRVTGTAGGRSASIELAVATRFRSLSTGLLHTCFVREDGTGLCAGDNASGQLGTGSTTSTPLPTVMAGGIAFASVSSGGAHSCGLTAGGVAYCWGSNEAGQLGSGGGAAVSPVPVAVAGGHTFRSLAAGARHTCGITTAGAALCWGSNASGQLGAATPETCGGAPCSRAPAAVEGGRTFTTITVGADHTCALDGSGAAFCWGSGGALGNGTTGGSPTPAAVSGGLRFVGLGAGFSHTCVVTADGAAYCWGANTFGELGNGGGPASTVPVRVSGDVRFARVAAGGFHTCALTAEGSAYCWGANANGELGTSAGWNRSTPAPVAGGLLYGTLSLGRDHTCGLSLRGHAYCWGLGALGRGGDAPQTPKLVPEI